MFLKKRRIIFVCTKSITIDVFLKSMINDFKDEYNILLCATDIAKIKDSSLKKLNIFFPSKWFEFFNFKKILISIFKLNKLVNSNPKDIIFCHTPVASHFVRIATFFKKPKIIYFVHGFRFNDARKSYFNYFFKFVELMLEKNTSGYISINKSDYKFIKDISKCPVIKVNGIGLDKKKIIKKKINTKFFNVGMIGAYKKNKGYENVINNLDIISKLIPNIYINAYGYGSINEFKEMIKIKNIKNFKLNKFTKNIIDKIIDFDVLLHPSFREGLSVSIMQSLQYNTPIIARNIVGNRDLIKNNYNGFLFKTDKQMIDKLKILYLNKNLRTKLSSNASKSITKDFLKPHINKKIKKFINKF